MNRLIDAFEAFLSAAAQSGAEVAKTASFTLENVNWKGTLSRPKPSTHPVMELHLGSACANSGAQETSSYAISQALMTASDQLEWRASSKCREDGPDIAILLPKLAVATVIGPGAPLPSDKVYAGFSLQAPDTYYPPHAHYAEESYWIIGGNGDWKVGTKPWFAVEPGDSIYHKSEARHVMQTNEQPLLTVWLWTSHLDSEVVIVRG